MDGAAAAHTAKAGGPWIAVAEGWLGQIVSLRSLVRDLGTGGKSDLLATSVTNNRHTRP